MAEESAVKVCVRVRPLSEREESRSPEDAEPVKHFWKANKKSIHQTDDDNPSKSFSFDRVFTADESTNQLYQAIAKPLVVSAVEGYNGTIFAYGQTSSGKTFTMMGDGGGVPGVIPLAVEDVFQSITNLPKKEFLLRVSYMEIYNETVADLLVSSWKRKPLEVRETIDKNVFVPDLTEEVVTSPAQALAWIRKGEKNRHYGKTKMNQRSSRSHTIFRMIIESRDRSDPASGENADGGIIVSHLNLVDLAGSERASQTGAEGTRFKEGCNINRSLFTLGQVIKKLTDENQKLFTSYRDSKLTRILQNSLGGNAKTVIICTITPVALEETLSTLQFASTAKKMKNDPHVTEVSDDGALLKRYRNEIVDLKRRLQEVSSVTQTTATEKEVLSQLLQEKEMLQREQEDRIRNLTTLLVTSTTQTTVRKVPKRRVTWGGKMLKLVGPAATEDHPWDLQLSQSFVPKRKAYGNSLSELCEDYEDFDSRWEIPDEPQDETETSQSSVTVRSFGDSPTGGSSDWMSELSSKVSTLEQQLDLERRQKEEAWGEVELLKSSVAELQLERTSGPGQLQLQPEAGLRQDAVEKVEMLELRLADVEQQNQTLSETVEQMRRQFAETAQLCETLAKEKEEVLTERDYLRQELGMFVEQTNMLEEEKAALSQEVWELRETEEFKTLEDEVNREHQRELQVEISKLKTSLEASEVQCLQLQSKLDGLSEQLKTKTEFAEELQSLGGKDLMREVAKLRRSLDDAEGVSRDTKKEWALLRSENMALEETNVTLGASQEKMELEVNSLRLKLESEKSRNRSMQSDLQKELNVAFEENAALSSLLAGKVPKNQMDSFDLEKTVKRLNKELAASREVQETLGAQLEEFPVTVDKLSKQVQQQSEELLSAEARRQEEARLLREALQASEEEVDGKQQELCSAVLREKELRQQCEDMTHTMESLGSDLQRGEAERNQLLASVEEKVLQLEESQQLKVSLEGTVEEMRRLVQHLEEKLADSEASRSTEEDIGRELQEQVKELSEELEQVRAAMEALVSEQKAHSSAEETEKLLSTITSLSAEGEQLRARLDQAAGTQTVLESLQLELQEEKQRSSDLTKLCEQKESDAEKHMLMLSEELQCVREKEASARRCVDELDELRSTLDSVSAERDQLKLDLQDNVDIMIEVQGELRTALQNNQKQKELIKQLKTSRPEEDPSESRAQSLTEELQSAEAERARLQSEKESGHHKLSDETRELQHRVTSLSEESKELQEMLDTLRQEKQQLAAQLEDTTQSLHTQMKSLGEELQQVKAERAQLEDTTRSLLTQVRSLAENLQSLEAERDVLLSEKESSQRSFSEETRELQHQVTVLQEKRWEREEALEELTQDKHLLKAKLDLISSEMEEQRAEEEQRRREQEALLHQQVQQLEEQLQQKQQQLEEQKQQQQQLEEQLQQQQQQQQQLEEQLQQQQQQQLEEQLQQKQKQQLEAQFQQKQKQQLEEQKQQQQQLEEQLQQQQQQQQLEEQLQQKQKQQLEAQFQKQQQQQQLEEQLQKQLEHREKQASAQASADVPQQLLSEANATVSSLPGQLDVVEPGGASAREAMLQDSSEQLRVALRKFQLCVGLCSACKPSVLEEVYRDLGSLDHTFNVSLPQTTSDAYEAVRQERLTVRVEGYMRLLQELVRKDVALFEEQRLQDVLLCRAQAPDHWVKQDDFHGVWERRLSQLLERRLSYLQKLFGPLEVLRANVRYFGDCQVRQAAEEYEAFRDELYPLLEQLPVDFSQVEAVLRRQLEHRRAAVAALDLQDIPDECRRGFEELQQLEAELDAELREQSSRNHTALQALKGAPLKTELSLLEDNQQLAQELQRAQDTVQALCLQNEQLKEAPVKTSSCGCSHQQDAHHLLEERGNTIQTLQSRLEESQTLVSQSSAQLEKLRAKVVQTEVALSSASDQHQKELQRLSDVLREKDDSVRKLKETLRRQQGEESILTGADLHARLTQPRGLSRSSALLEKSRLEKEVQQLHRTVTELESVASSQQAEVNKWKSRALKLKSKAEADRAPSPRTPRRRGFPFPDQPNLLHSPKRARESPLKVLDSPKKVLDSPKKVLDSPKKVLDSPKSRFFDVGSAEVLRRTAPKQFFDNSRLGTLPDVDPEKEWWDLSPSQKEMCKTQ